VSLGIKWLLANGKSNVVIEQVNREWDCVKDTMYAYYTDIQKIKGHFVGIKFQDIPRNNNVATNVLSKLGSKRALVPAGVRLGPTQAVDQVVGSEQSVPWSARSNSSTSPWCADDRKRGWLTRAFPSLPTSSTSSRRQERAGTHHAT
jgi:hypothetical protein